MAQWLTELPTEVWQEGLFYLQQTAEFIMPYS